MLDVVNKLNKKELIVLFADDNPSIRNVISEGLYTVFSKVYLAENGAQGKEILNKHYVDILITDINMPEENGIDLIMYAREKHNVIPIIITTAHDEFQMYKDFDAFKVLIKPYSVIDIIKAVDKLIKNIDSHRETKNALDKLEEVYPEAQKILDLIKSCDVCSNKGDEKDKETI